MSNLYTAQEVADKLKIKKTTVYELIKRGELASSKIGKQLRVSEEQLSQYLGRSQAAAPPVQPAAFPPESSLLKREYLLHSSGTLLCGPNTPPLDYLLEKISVQSETLPILHSHMNSYNSLYALYFKKAHIAASCMNLSDIRSLIPGERLKAIKLYDYPLGIYVQKGNPKNILSPEDFSRKDVSIQNRERGSSRRIWLDRYLKEAHISEFCISGYTNEAISDMAAAASVAGGTADAALGEAFVSRYYPNTDFIPLTTRTMYLVILSETAKTSQYSTLIELIQSDTYKKELHNFTGYDTSHAGEIINI